MTHPLDGCWAKLDRAKEHLDSLNEEVAAQEKFIVCGTKVDFERSQVILEIQKLPDLPIRWGTMIGDILHNLRSALDHLAFQLVGLDSRRYWKPSQFPIVDGPDDYGSSARLQGTMKRLSPEHRALIEWCQGYRRGYGLFAPTNRSPLGLLRELSNIDKHRLILGTALAVRMDGFEAVITGLRDATPGKWSHYFAEVPLYAGAELLKLDIVITGPNPQVNMNVTLPLFVAFNIGGDLVKRLEEIGAYVVDTVREFEPSFESA